jgi:hypothetical protein
MISDGPAHGAAYRCSGEDLPQVSTSSPSRQKPLADKERIPTARLKAAGSSLERDGEGVGWREKRRYSVWNGGEVWLRRYYVNDGPVSGVR